MNTMERVMLAEALYNARESANGGTWEKLQFKGRSKYYRMAERLIVELGKKKLRIQHDIPA